ncbi:hypothetical protein [Pedobacter jamesrossensis]|uniref:Uncharacterized protein n=1 Tax=Pedobacter jamesrossensis TaxID=1908238 RepID=A0ABV8NPH3_9SPHI
MKTSIIIFFFVALSTLCSAQKPKQSLDYQYYRTDKSYYAFELYKDSSSEDDKLMLNFVSNETYKKIDNIYFREGKTEIKVKFKAREEVVSSDNPELKFYPIIFSSKELENKKIGCNAHIVFKLDNGSILTLPFSICTITEQLQKN